MFRELRYPSKDNITEIHACMWIPTGKIYAILQIEHGMIEHIRRYEKIAELFNKIGILVCGEDHLGHGESVIDSSHYGYFAKDNPEEILIEDSLELTKIIKNEYPDIPYYLLGHSFGSFLVRNYANKYSKEIDGLIIMGSAYHNVFKMNSAIIFNKFHQMVHGGWHYRSKLMKNLTVGKFAKSFNEGNPNKWLTKNEEVLASYENDSYCAFTFTCNAYQTMFKLIKNANLKSKAKTIRKDLPILIISGEHDPVGGFGKNVSKLEDFYKNLKIENVYLKLYENARHEIFSESNRNEVINDIINFINKTNAKK